MQQERWLSVDEIAAHMEVNPDTVYKWIERRDLQEQLEWRKQIPDLLNSLN